MRYLTPEEVTALTKGSDSLRQWKEVYLKEDCSDVKGFHENGLFRECTFHNMNGLTLKNCALYGSSIEPRTIEEALNYTVTLDCNSFSYVSLNELAFDLVLLLLVRSKGNTEKRKKLIHIIGEDRVRELLYTSYPGNFPWDRGL